MDSLVCPMCHGQLLRGDAACSCARCRASYPIRQGIPCFNASDEWHGELSRTEMEELIGVAERSGWQAALERTPETRKLVRLLTDERRSGWARACGLTETDVVLDLGCGLGGVSLQVARTAQRVVSLDSCFERVAFLEVVSRQMQRTNIVPVCSGSILQLPFPDRSFDLVTLIGVLEYLPLGVPEAPAEVAQRRALEEVARVLKPEGRVYIATHNRFGWQHLTGGLDHNGVRFGPVLPRWLAQRVSLALRDRPYRIVYHSLNGYRRLLDAAGFGGVEMYWPVPSYQFPERLVALGQGNGVAPAVGGGEQRGKLKQAVVNAVTALGLLPYCVPSYAMVARRRRGG